MEYKQFDVVRILSTKEVSYLNGPAGRPASPHGEWQIVGIMPNGQLLLSKDETIIKTVVTNVQKIGSYNPELVSKELDKVNNRILKRKKDGNSGSSVV